MPAKRRQMTETSSMGPQSITGRSEADWNQALYLRRVIPSAVHSQPVHYVREKIPTCSACGNVFLNGSRAHGGIDSATGQCIAVKACERRQRQGY